jgi:hypothetical protein
MKEIREKKKREEENRKYSFPKELQCRYLFEKRKAAFEKKLIILISRDILESPKKTSTFMDMFTKG